MCTYSRVLTILGQNSLFRTVGSRMEAVLWQNNNSQQGNKRTTGDMR